MLSRLRTVITLLRHPKVPRLPKFLLIAAIGYVLLPFDAIPDVAPVVGWLDDILFLMGALSLLFGAAPPATPSSGPDGPSPRGPVIDVTPEPSNGEGR